jgi:LemA protein
MAAALIIIVFIILIVVIAAVYVFNTQRTLVNMDEICKNALSQISVQLSTRWDAVSTLVALTGQYSKHEHDTLTDVIAQRRSANVVTPQDVNSQQDFIGQVLGRLMAVSEQYPQLQASALYADNMASIRGYEENVRMSRMVYNDTATRINRMVRQWPSSFVASMLHFTMREYLEAEKDKKDFPPIANPNNGSAPAENSGNGGNAAPSDPSAPSNPADLAK